MVPYKKQADEIIDLEEKNKKLRKEVEAMRTVESQQIGGIEKLSENKEYDMKIKLLTEEKETLKQKVK